MESYREYQKEHDNVIKWKHFLRYWPFVRGIHRLPVNSPHKGQWCGPLMFSLICTWINGWVNNREAGNLRCHCAHYDVIVMIFTNSTHSKYNVITKLAFCNLILGLLKSDLLMFKKKVCLCVCLPIIANQNVDFFIRINSEFMVFRIFHDNIIYIYICNGISGERVTNVIKLLATWAPKINMYQW